MKWDNKKNGTPPVTLAWVIGVCALLAACGGGGAGSVNTPVSQQTPEVVQGAPLIVGTVDGFGSLIVDGKRIDNHGVAAQAEKENGVLNNVELKLGHRVEVQHDGNLVAKQIRVRSTVEGKVQAIDLKLGSLKVVGQTILVNADTEKGPVTVFEAPYTQLADVKLDDNVEVHALIKQDTAGKPVLQATRIGKREADSMDRLHGVIAALNSTSKQFKLGDLLVDYADAKVLPEKVVLENGQEAMVSFSTGSATANHTVKAKQVVVLARKSESEGKPVELGGAISALDTTAKTMVINGTTVDMSVASFNQPNKSIADLKVGMYVIVKGVYVSKQNLKASTIVIRGVEEKDKTVALHGTILEYQSNASFKVRDVLVNASAAKIDEQSCKGTTLANHMQVEVKGALLSTGAVKASSVKCETVKEASSIVGKHGVASKVDATAKSFTLTTEKETVVVKWGAQTVFVRATADALEGKKLTVEGTLVSGVLQAQKIILAQK